MRLINLVPIAIVTLASAFLIASCGSKDEGPTSPTATQTGTSATTVATTGPISSATAISTAPPQASITSVGDLISKTPKFSPFELDNVRYGGTFRNQSDTSIGNWDPKFAPARFDSALYILDRLVRLLPNENDVLSHFGPGLAESWKISEDSKTYTFNLRKGVKFHNLPPVNGREFTSDDAVFSYRRYMEKDSTSAGAYAQVESIEAIDKYTVVFKLKDPNVWALEDLFRTHQYVLPRELIEQPGGITTVVIGTGPFILKDYANRRGGLFVRNPDYWAKDEKGNPLPYVDEVREIYVTDAATNIAGLRTDQLDMAGPTGGLEGTLALVKSKPELRVFGSGNPLGEGIAFNTTRKPWDDAKVRRAVSMSLDKYKIGEGWLGTSSSGWVWGGPVPWSSVSDKPFTVDEYGPYYKYDPQAAKKLLVEAGLADGKLKIANPLIVRSPTSYDQLIAIVQNQLKQNDIEMSTLAADPSAYSIYNATRQIKDIGQQHATTGNFTLNWGASNLFLEEIPVNQSFVRDPEIRKVVFQIRATQDPAKLREYAKILWDFETQGVWRMWLPGQPGVFVTSPRLRNVTRRTSDRLSAQFWTPWLADAPRTQP